MKRISAIALFAAATFIAAGSALAQNSSVKATIPFNFKVGNSTLPAGTYTISSRTNGHNILAINNWQKNVHVLSMGMSDAGDLSQDNVLVFHKYESKNGTQYFLSEVRSSGASIDMRLVDDRAEKKARAKTEEAGLSVSDPVLLALK